ncbi:putative mutT-like protein [Alloactinosynnema sp. L-07]|nr:putative mutT-like protein [Alloactinosynnema sp. L-07]
MLIDDATMRVFLKDLVTQRHRAVDPALPAGCAPLAGRGRGESTGPMAEAVVTGAAIVREYRLFVARRSRPQSVAGFWELPGAEVAPGQDEQSALSDRFTSEFSISLRCVDRILSDRALTAWPTDDEDYDSAILRIWRCQLPSESTLDLDLGDPRPNMYVYDETRWVPIDELDQVSPWRDADRITASEIADHYLADDWWQAAD